MPRRSVFAYLHKRVLFLSFCLITGLTLICLYAITITRTLTLISPLSRVSSPSRNSGPQPSPTPTPLPGYTLLLMGKAGAGHEGGSLTDTMLLVRILDQSNQIFMLSIPRDLWVHIPYGVDAGAEGKLNSAYAIGLDGSFDNKLPEFTGPYGGGNLAARVVTDVTGLGVDSYVTIDFSGFEQAIDSIGGIELTVMPAFTDYEYPIAGRESLDCSHYTPNSSLATPSAALGLVPEQINTPSLSDLIAGGQLDPKLLSGLAAQFPCRYERLHFAAGNQHMDGRTALKFVRSRHSAEAGSDFARTQRQRQVVETVATKLFSLGEIAKIPGFFSTLRAHVDDGLLAAELISLLSRARAIRGYTVIQRSLTTDNYLKSAFTADRQLALFPLAGANVYTPIRNWLSAIITPGIPFFYPVTEVVGPAQSPRVTELTERLNVTGFPAHAAKWLPREATTSATLIQYSDNIDPKALDTIRNLAGISPGFIKMARPINSSDTLLRILLP